MQHIQKQHICNTHSACVLMCACDIFCFHTTCGRSTWCLPLQHALISCTNFQTQEQVAELGRASPILDHPQGFSPSRARLPSRTTPQISIGVGWLRGFRGAPAKGAAPPPEGGGMGALQNLTQNKNDGPFYVNMQCACLPQSGPLCIL